MRVLITGGTGFVGQRLVKALLAEGHELRLVGRTPKLGLPPGVAFSPWNAMEGEPTGQAVRDVEAVVHLAGEPVAQRWTPEVKRRIRQSRVEGTRALVAALRKARAIPRAFVCASATGYYGDRGDEYLTEESAAGRGFLPEVCAEWEAAADEAAALGARVFKVRIGIVLGREGGALKKMLPAFRMGVAGRLGNGKQWMSWIHVDDLVGMLMQGLTAGAKGVWNGVAPNPARNEEFTATLAKVLWRPALIPAPAFAIQMVFGEMAEVVLASQRVAPAAAMAAGYRFRFPTLEGALRDLLG